MEKTLPLVRRAGLEELSPQVTGQTPISGKSWSVPEESLLQETLIGLSQQQGEIAQTLRLVQCLAEAGALKPATVRHGVALIDCCLIDPEGLGEKLERIPEEYRHQAALLADLLLHSQSHLQAQGELYLTPYQVDPAQHSQRRIWGFRPQWGR